MIRKTLFSILLILISVSMNAQEAKFKALFMYNFTKYLEWPAAKKNGDFVIGVYGASAITHELNVIAAKKKVGAQSIVVKVVNNPAELGTCNMLYIPENKSSRLTEVMSRCTGNGTVVITDKDGLAKKGAGLNYVNVNGKQSFEINKNNIEKQGVKVNSVLLSLGIVVE